MLNLNPNNKVQVDESKYSSFSKVELRDFVRAFSIIISIIFFITLIFLFLPWTQNIRANGVVTTFEPDKRPQTINSVIPGRIEKWYVIEGDYVKKGDTILNISEVKDDYFNPDILNNYQNQINAKSESVKSYEDKINALENQYQALLKNQKLKLEQNLNKVKQNKLKVNSDSMDLEAEKINFKIAQERFERMEKLYEKGLKSQTEYESRKLTLQSTQAKLISAENKLLSAVNELINSEIEYNSIQNDFADKLAKVQSDKFSAMSAKFDTEVEINKLQNQLGNLSVRTGYYYITAPQEGYITKTIQSGIGEVIKEGAELVSIMPVNYNLLVELYIEPLDLPLIEKGQHVRLIFDGWPSIVFSGWPNSSVGTFGGTVYAYDNFISNNGKYRILIIPDVQDVPWPEQLRVGSGSVGMMLLKDVPVWYELWRQVNGFPPDFYKTNLSVDKKLKSESKDKK